MNPSEFPSLVHDVALTSANYSGGTFGDAVQGAGFWDYQGVTPMFDTRAGIEGKLFTGLAADSVIADMLALHEATVVMIAQPATGAQGGFIGGTYSAGNSWWMFTNANRLFARSPPAEQGITVADATGSTRPTVFAGGWSPRTGRIYASVNDGAIAVGQSTGANIKEASVRSTEVGIGRHRTTYFNGWISRVHIFSRCLQERDPSGFASLVTSRMALIGL